MSTTFSSTIRDAREHADREADALLLLREVMRKLESSPLITEYLMNDYDQIKTRYEEVRAKYHAAGVRSL